VALQRGENYQVEINFTARRILATSETCEAAEHFIEQKLTELNHEGLDSLTLSSEQRTAVTTSRIACTSKKS